ncbi:MAG: hypothetical protein ACOZJX_05335 [Pseudomonadota bacterium]
MPSFSALARICFYWLFWALVVTRLVQGRESGQTWSTIAWIVGTAAVTVWFTWVKLHDDKQVRLHGEDARPDPEIASPATRFVGAATLVAGGLGCLLLGALLPSLRGTLLVLGFAALVAAILMLFFGRRSKNDIDL